MSGLKRTRGSGSLLRPLFQAFLRYIANPSVANRRAAHSPERWQAATSRHHCAIQLRCADQRSLGLRDRLRTMPATRWRPSRSTTCGRGVRGDAAATRCCISSCLSAMCFFLPSGCAVVCGWSVSPLAREAMLLFSRSSSIHQLLCAPTDSGHAAPVTQPTRSCWTRSTRTCPTAPRSSSSARTVSVQHLSFLCLSLRSHGADCAGFSASRSRTNLCRGRSRRRRRSNPADARVRARSRRQERLHRTGRQPELRKRQLRPHQQPAGNARAGASRNLMVLNALPSARVEGPFPIASH